MGDTFTPNGPSQPAGAMSLRAALPAPKKAPPAPKNPRSAPSPHTSSAVVSADSASEDASAVRELMRHGADEGQVVYSRPSEMVAAAASEAPRARPSEEEARRAAVRTQLAIDRALGDSSIAGRVAAKGAASKREARFVRYTPKETAAGGGGQRVLRIAEEAVDPLAPQQFKMTKTANRSSDVPVPVMHSPSRKLTDRDRKNWDIPPCVSNWRNFRGHTVPLDKRVAAEGRGLRKAEVSSEFASLSEALYAAEQVARQDIEARGRLQEEVALKRKRAQEEERRALAAQARAAVAAAAAEAASATPGDEAMRRERDEMRREAERDIRREYQMERRGRAAAAGASQAAAELRKPRDAGRERDVSEKVALGQYSGGGGGGSSEGMFDQRLFGKGSGVAPASLASGEVSDLYDRPLLNGSSASKLYRPGGAAAAAADDEPRQFKGKREFAGTAESRASLRGAGGRSKPVQFEKEADPFGMDGLFSGEERRSAALDGVGKRGHMSAAGADAKRQRR